MNNEIQNLLLSLGICDANSIEEFYPRVRDRDDVKVMRCKKSGVIFLSRSDQITDKYYEKKSDFTYWSTSNRKQALLDDYDNDIRRVNDFQDLICDKKWLDIGTGVGGILDLLSDKASEVCAVEPQEFIRKELIKCNYKVYKDLVEVENERYDIITLFHVYEHMQKPLDELVLILKKMVTGGKVLIEVPHANDFLMSFLDLEAFKAFNFWSEHLILHTRKSLEILLRRAGFVDISVTGCQRYNLANHMHWLAKGEPGGHKKWPSISNPELDSAYAKMLTDIDKTDTLIAIAQK